MSHDAYHSLCQSPIVLKRIAHVQHLIVTKQQLD